MGATTVSVAASDIPKIPIQNLYFLLCYAWNQLDQGALVDVARLPSNNLVDLFAAVLCNGIDHIARRGIQQGYEERNEDLTSLRGRIDGVASARRLLLIHGRAACHFDELSTNTPANRTLKATLRILLAGVEDSDLRGRVRSAHARFSEIDEMCLSTQAFRNIQLGSNARFYRFLLHVCEFIHGSWLIDQRHGKHRFRDFVRDERTMSAVFERFIYNFLRLEKLGWSVSRDYIKWEATSNTDVNLSLLPQMRTDITLRRGNQYRIVDAKYYSEMLSHYHGSSKLQSAHLYQMMSYVSNASAADDSQAISGMLVYPRVDREIRESYVIQGIKIDLCTIDLNADWQAIRHELRKLFA
jgi:5-methylcytosine-specific restriction enzyme subunit McrC